MEDNELERLLARARGGDRQALGDLLSHLWQQANNQAGAVLGAALRGRLGASDVAQEACLRAHRAFLQFRGDTAAELRAWFGQIVRNFLADMGQKHGPQVARQEPGESRFEELPDAVTSPSQHLIGVERQAHVHAALARLPAHYRQVILLRALEQLPFEDVADRMNLTAGYARVLFLRAIGRLRDELGESI